MNGLESLQGSERLPCIQQGAGLSRKPNETLKMVSYTLFPVRPGCLLTIFLPDLTGHYFKQGDYRSFKRIENGIEVTLPNGVVRRYTQGHGRRVSVTHNSSTRLPMIHSSTTSRSQRDQQQPLPGSDVDILRQQEEEGWNKYF